MGYGRSLTTPLHNHLNMSMLLGYKFPMLTIELCEWCLFMERQNELLHEGWLNSLNV
jgi:hypothetical protein